MSNLVEFAKEELKHAGLEPTEDEMQKQMNEHIIHMVEEFSEEEHSGTTAPYALSILKRLLNWEPITPLTGKDEEWQEVGIGMFQNKRCSKIFKDGKNGQAYDIEGTIFRNQNGATFTNEYSFKPVSFPYMPEEPIVVDVYEKTKE